MEKLGQDEIDHRQRQVVCISQDSFYRELNPTEKLKASKGLFNFDHPGNRINLRTLKFHIIQAIVQVSIFSF